MEQNERQREHEIEVSKQEIEARKAVIEEYRHKIEQAKLGNETLKVKNMEAEKELNGLLEEFRRLQEENVSKGNP